MNDTQFFGGKITLSGPFKAVLLYAVIDVFTNGLVGLGRAMFELNQVDWQAWWTMKKIGWWLVEIGSILVSAAITIKAATSNSTK